MRPLQYLQPTVSRFARYLVFVREIKAAYFIVLVSIILFILAVVVHSTGTIPIDVQASIAIQKLRTPFLDVLMQFVTNLGNFGVQITVAALCGIYLLVIGKARSALVVALSLLSYPLNVFMKNSVDRLRPHSALIQIISPSGGFSFPSGHAMISMAVYGTVAYLLWVYLRSSRAFIVLFAALVIFLIGVSRIYLGVHWMTDVIGGWLGGLLILLILVQLHRKLTLPVLESTSVQVKQ